MKPIIYNSKDTGAPQLTSATNSLSTILKACLVTGYGDKLPAGWEVVHENISTKTLALRSTAASSLKHIFFIDKEVAGSAPVKAYTGWDSSTNIGINNYASSNRVINKLGSGTGYNPGWVIVANSTFFYIYMQGHETAQYGFITMFGDIKSIRPGESASMLATQTSTVWNQNSGRLEYVDLSTKRIGKFPYSPYGTRGYGFGDFGPTTPDGGMTGISSTVAVFSEYIMYATFDNNWEPCFKIPGALMPYCSLPSNAVHNINTIENQLPYIGTLLGLQQPWQGRIWMHTDDWDA